MPFSYTLTERGPTHRTILVLMNMYHSQLTNKKTKLINLWWYVKAKKKKTDCKFQYYIIFTEKGRANHHELSVKCFIIKEFMNKA